MCGITALISNDNSNIIYDLYESLYHLQHRGQDAFGLSFIDNKRIKNIKHNYFSHILDLLLSILDYSTLY